MAWAFSGLSQILGFSSSRKTSIKRSDLLSKSKIPPQPMAAAVKVGDFVFDGIDFLHGIQTDAWRSRWKKGQIINDKFGYG
jgi:hypothetical protein